MPSKRSQPPSVSNDAPAPSWPRSRRRFTTILPMSGLLAGGVGIAAIPARDHRAHLVDGSRGDHHDDVDDDEQDDDRHAAEMQQTGRLATAENVEQPGPRRIDAGRHGEASEDHARDHDDEDRGIAELLQDIVGAPMWKFQAKMVEDVAGQAPKIAWFW